MSTSSRNNNDSDDIDIAIKMAMILGTLIAGIIGVLQLQQPMKRISSVVSTNKAITTLPTSSFLPNPITEPSKYSHELFVAIYTPIWILFFAYIVLTQYYERLTPTGYIILCTSIALPFVLQPIFFPGGVESFVMLLRKAQTSSNSNIHRTTISPDANRPILQRYSFKANVWIAVYSLIGNYWYTHYFYSVLHASYTMPNAIRFNNVPIQMYCATHFYFSSYHLFSNCLLRKICTTYQRTIYRDVLFVSVIGVFSYFTAFMETLTISSYPYYTFEDRNMAYTIGSAFYGIYFIVSFPAFYFFDRHIDDIASGRAVSIWETIVESCGYGMIILFLLDFVRLYMDILLTIGRDPNT